VSAAGIPAERLAQRLKELVSLRPVLADGKIAIEAGSGVGTIQVGDLRVDVQPRLAAAEMVTLIRYAYGGDLGWQRSEIGLDRVGLDELLCIVLADELSSLRQKGLSRQYVNQREKLEVMRGRPDFLASFPWNDKGMTNITCRYHELTCDNLDNQLVRAGLERAALMQTRIATRRRLLEHLQVWKAIASTKNNPSVSVFTVARTRYTRLSEHYRLAHHLCELVLAAQTPYSIYTSGSVVTSGLCLDMADLFELFVTRLLRELFADRGFTVAAQAPDRGAFLDAASQVYRRVRPDLVVFERAAPVAVIDAKYKDYWKADNDTGTPAKRISNEDLYQLFFYSERLRNRYGLKKAPPAFIISPLPAADERERAFVVQEQFRDVQWRAGTGVADSSIQLVLLPLTDLLRSIRRSGSPGPEAACLVQQIHPKLARTHADADEVPAEPA